MRPDVSVEDAKRVLRTEYYASIKAMAQDVLSEDVPDGADNDEYLYNRIHEMADGSGWVIYTSENYIALMASDYHAASEDEAAEDLPKGHRAIPFLAYLTVRHDLEEACNMLRSKAEPGQV